MRPRRLDREFIGIRIPHHRMHDRAVDAGRVHHRQRLFFQERRLPVVGRWRSLTPEMDLRVNDHHGGWLSLEIFVNPLTHGCCRSP